MSSQPADEPHRVLFADDDKGVLQAAELLLSRRGFRMTAASRPSQIWPILACEAVDAILLDLNFAAGATSGEEGLGILRELMQAAPGVPVVVVTGHSGVKVAVEAIRCGAADFVMKPWSNERLVATLTEAIAASTVQTASATPSAGLVETDVTGPLLGASIALGDIKDFIARAAGRQAAVFISGETGVGKSHVAHALHRLSAAGRGPLVAIDLIGVPAEPAEERLFFQDTLTEALQRANGGTLLLDGVSGLKPSAQGRLLTALEAAKSQGVSCRVLATSTVRRSILEANGFRADLLYALSTLELHIPPLRERRDDIGVLADHYVQLFRRRHGRTARTLTTRAEARLIECDWTGNVRALRQCVERAVVLSEGGALDAEDFQLPETPRMAETPSAQPAATLADSERLLVDAALRRHSFNISRAAAELGLTRAALYRRMGKHGL